MSGERFTKSLYLSTWVQQLRPLNLIHSVAGPLALLLPVHGDSTHFSIVLPAGCVVAVSGDRSYCGHLQGSVFLAVEAVSLEEGSRWAFSRPLSDSPSIEQRNRAFQPLQVRLPLVNSTICTACDTPVAISARVVPSELLG